VTEQVTDALQRFTAAQQMDRQRVTQDMRPAVGGHDARLVQLAPQPRVDLAPQRAMRRPAGQEDFPMPRRGALGQQVVQHRLPHRPGQRQCAPAAGLRREDDDLVVRPVDVV
jgi:hypothetical protein